MSGGSSQDSVGFFAQEELPETFTVKYLGHAESRGLWGIKNTRGPVDTLVALAKQPGAALPILKLTVSRAGCTLGTGVSSRHYPIDTVSYGVQDLVYTRVFSMIVVQDKGNSGNSDRSPFQCHAFVCESRQAARKVTYCLATAFQEYSRSIRANETGPKRFAIDLRSPEDLEAELKASDSSEA
uniref:PID domain-containing protein n=1 Tax=Graphocephala atropunctata TaxID=36148 RepID=A0A1B6L4J0_9HEMI